MSWDSKLFNRHLSTRRFGREFYFFEEIDSTNRWLLENQETALLTGAVVLANHQTAGRGRQGRAWTDISTCSLLFSVLLRTTSGDNGFPLLSILPAIALAGVLTPQLSTGHQVSLKWPNDVLLDGKKVAGVLGQSVTNGQQRIIVLGMGVNVATPSAEFPEEFRHGATSLQDATGRNVQRELLLADLLAGLEQLHDDWIKENFDQIRARWESYGPKKGTRLSRVEAGQVFTGQYVGLGKHGELRLTDSDGRVRELISGDIYL